MFVYFCDDVYDYDSCRSSIIAPSPLQASEDKIAPMPLRASEDKISPTPLQASVDETPPPPFKGYGG